MFACRKTSACRVLRNGGLSKARDLYRRFQKGLDVFLHLVDGEWGGGAFECGDEVLAEDISARGVVGDFLHCVFGVVRVAH